MQFNTLGYTSKDIGLQGNYIVIIPQNEIFFKLLYTFYKIKGYSIHG